MMTLPTIPNSLIMVPFHGTFTPSTASSFMLTLELAAASN